MRRARKFFLQASALTATNLLMRSIAMAFQVYIAGKIGAAGIGLFQLITSVYLMAVTIANSGIRLAATRLISERMGRDQPREMLRATRCCLGYSVLFGAMAMALLYFLAPVAGSEWAGDERTVLSLRILALSLPFVACSSAISGYFVAQHQSVKLSAVQFSEQVIRISSTAVALFFLGDGGIELSCAALTLGMTASEIYSFLVLLILIGADIRRHRNHHGASNPVIGALLKITVPLSLSSYARSALSTLQHLLIPRGLQQYGGNQESALASYGVIQGMSLPILLFPSALIGVAADLIVPELTEVQVKGHKRNLSYILERLYQVGLVFSIAVGGLCLCFAKPLGLLIYHNYDAAKYIAILAPLIPAMYMDTLVDGMLKGVGEYQANMRYNMIDAATGLLLVWTLIPRFGIAGYVFSIAATELLNFILSALRLARVTEFRLKLRDWLRNCLCFAGGFYLFQIFFRGISRHITTTAGLISGCFIILSFYFLLLRATGGITREELRWFFSLLRQEEKINFEESGGKSRE